MDLNALDAVVVAVIIGVVKGLTQAGMSKRFAPAVAVVLGVVGGLLYIFPSDPKMGVLVGLVMGLSAVGLYSGAKNSFKKK